MKITANSPQEARFAAILTIVSIFLGKTEEAVMELTQWKRFAQLIRELPRKCIQTFNSHTTTFYFIWDPITNELQVDSEDKQPALYWNINAKTEPTVRSDFPTMSFDLTKVEPVTIFEISIEPSPTPSAPVPTPA